MRSAGMPRSRTADLVALRDKALGLLGLQSDSREQGDYPDQQWYLPEERGTGWGRLGWESH